jgi:hypothetical protein
MVDLKINVDNPIKEFSLVMYEPLRESDIIDLGITRYAYIYHDNDIKENGQAKEPHYHYYIKIPNRKRVSTLINYFEKKYTTNVRVESTKNYAALIRYFTHCEYEDKYQYNINLIQANFDISKCFLPQEDSEDLLIDIATKIIIKEFNTFTDIVQYCIDKGNISVVSKNTYFIKSLLERR